MKVQFSVIADRIALVGIGDCLSSSRTIEPTLQGYSFRPCEHFVGKTGGVA